MSKQPFEVGDRVKYIGRSYLGLSGKMGTILRIDPANRDYPCKVWFDGNEEGLVCGLREMELIEGASNDQD